MIKKIIYYSVIVLSIASCSKESGEFDSPNIDVVSNGYISLNLNTRAEETEGDLTTNTFEKDETIRLGIYFKNDNGTSDKYTEYAGIENTKIFGKLKEQTDGDLAWRYGYDYEGDLSSIGFKVDITAPYDMPYIAGCAPFSDGDDIQNIAYDITNCDNFMMLDPYKIPIEMEQIDGIWEVTEPSYNVDLTFKQTLAKFEIRIQNKQQTYQNVGMTYRYPFGSAPPRFWLIPLEENILMSKASFDATSGIYSDKTYYEANGDNGDKLLDLVPLRIFEYNEAGYDIALYEEGLFKYDLYVHPIENLGEGIKLALGYNQVSIGDKELNENEMKLSTSSSYYTDLVVNDKLIINRSTIGSDEIKAGYKYCIYITMDNYFKVDNIVVDTEWVDKSTTPFTGEL